MNRGAWAVLALLSLSDCTCAADDCQRAAARLSRLHAKRATPSMRPYSTDAMIDSCRHNKYAKFDPALLCAMNASSDFAAEACIQAGVAEVVPSGLPTDGGSAQGWNPLLFEKPPK